MRCRRRITTSQLMVLGLGVACLIAQTLDLAFVAPTRDGADYVAAAYHLAREGVFGRHGGDTVAVPDNWREPLPAAILALSIIAHPSLDAGEASLACFLGQTEPCLEKVALLKIPFLVAMTLAAVLAALLVLRVTGSRLLAVAVLLSGSLLRLYTLHTDRFLSEAVAALLLTSLSILPLVGSMRNRRSLTRWVVVGTVLGLLILTKAVFYYSIPFFLFAIMLDERARTRSWKRAGRASLACALPLALLVGGWVARNYWTLGTTTLTGRGPQVLYLRAAMNEQLAAHRAAAARYFAGGAWWQAGKKNAPRNAPQLFAGTGSGGYRAAWQRRVTELREMKLGSAEVAARMSEEAKAKVIKNWRLHVAMMLPIGLRGMNVGHVFGFDNERGNRGTLSSRYLGFAMPKRLLTAPSGLSWALFGSLALCGLLGMFRRRRWLFWLSMPALFSLVMHTAFTHYIVRYSVPLIPVLFAELAICASLLIACMRRRMHNALRRPVNV